MPNLVVVFNQVIQPTSATPTGTVAIVVFTPNGQPGPTAPVLFNIPGLTTGDVAGSVVASGYMLSLSGIVPGSYTGSAKDSGGAVPVSFTFTVNPPPISGCMDPRSDTYNPDAVESDHSACTYSQGVTLATPLSELAANGRPVLITLNSVEIAGNVPALADAFISLEALTGQAVELAVNGYVLVAGGGLLPNSFNDAASLAEALNTIQPLAANYLIRQSQDEEVRITAREIGSAYSLTITSSNPAAVSAIVLPAVNQYRSQLRERWGCFVEIWVGTPGTSGVTFLDTYDSVYRSTYGRAVSSPGAGQPVLAQRLEMNYRNDNTYTFDIAPALRLFTGHAYPQPNGECPDRLRSYYLRFGELYALPGGVRRQQSVYLSPVASTIDAVELPATFFNNCYLLSSRPWPWRSYNASAMPTLLLGSLSGTDEFATRMLRTLYDGGGNVLAGANVREGRVTRLRVDDSTFAGCLSGDVRVELTADEEFSVASLDLLQSEGHPLTIANGQGGFDTVIFEGIREEITKRSSANYATPTGSATRSAQVPESFRLNSGLLTRAEWLWLRRELGNSPTTWLETPEGPQQVTITAYTPEADELLGIYTVSIDCEPQIQPVYGLTN